MDDREPLSASAQSSSDLQRLGDAAQALQSAARQVVDGRLDLLKAQWNLSLAATSLSLLALVTAAALIAATWTLLSAVAGYAVWTWLHHWAWVAATVIFMQLTAIHYLWHQSRHFLKQVALNLDPINDPVRDDTPGNAQEKNEEPEYAESTTRQ